MKLRQNGQSQMRQNPGMTENTRINDASESQVRMRQNHFACVRIILRAPERRVIFLHASEFQMRQNRKNASE